MLNYGNGTETSSEIFRQALNVPVPITGIYCTLTKTLPVLKITVTVDT
jgi:hypothetical protein